ncbi:hypothetical protein [Methylobacterium dankookense]|uniref:Uncharacterized protein n=1 Tax=Methylobacterium dankookense TaxID=560405 RepID=A0A564FSK9_9HYPH|nr:hypothetical protein [Methylobacterium dankookense]GJD59852.1 hypothetical protein IFDJLNFL_5783 [Methylobacterium dankookense]VUF11139.1 hypothetical protein MTDSW087_00812 [Methylobacterium dankookense]
MAAPPSGPDAAWGGFARGFLVSALCLVAGYLALAFALDPYDSGRSPLGTVGIRPQGPRTAAASRGRDPAFRGAIIGNSHIQLIEPERLSGLTGIPFVQLAIPATGPGEQFVVLDWFLRHHPHPQAIVLAPDDFWCGDDPAFRNDKPFPFWLFASDLPGYLRGLMRYAVAQEVIERIGWLTRKRRPLARADGWWDYEPDYLRLGFGEEAHRAPYRDKPVPDGPERGRAGPFPAADALRAALRAVPAQTPVVAVLPPVAHAALPRPGTPRAAAEAACKAAIGEALASHPRSALLDWRRDRPEARDPDLFFDGSHYRHPLARRVSEDIAAAIARLRAPTEQAP